MDRNTLNKILKILPDDFGFKAVFEEPENEVSKDGEVLILGIGKHKIELINGKYRPKNNDELKALCDIDSIELDDIDTSRVTDMSGIFESSTRKNFSGIESWEVSQVKSMRAMFKYVHTELYCSWDISRWNVSSVEDMSSMFEGSSFNGNIKHWNVENVENMEDMFYGAEQFHHSLNEWNINNKVNMRGIFANANYPKKYIESWREKVGEEMFEKAFICECGKEK